MSTLRKLLFALFLLASVPAFAQVEPYVDTLMKKEPFHMAGKVLVVGQEENIRAFEPYARSYKHAAPYVNVVNRYAHEFPGVRVYCMPIPTACEFYTPDSAKVYVRSQAGVINKMFAKLSPNVTPVDVYTVLARHAAEKIYARTDHHWLPLGAFYAAGAFAEVAGVPFHDLDSYDENVVKDFVGTMYNYSKEDAIKEAPEDFIYYVPRDVEYETTYIIYTLDDKRVEVLEESEPYQGKFFLHYSDGSPSAYCTFMGGDTKLTKVVTSVKNGRKLLILKDSFGNALPGFLFYSFEEIHVVDCRYYTESIRECVENNGITDILFANNMTHIGMERVVNKYNEYLD